MPRAATFAWCLCVSVVMVTGLASAQTAPPGRRLTPIAGDVYLAQFDTQTTVVMTTPEGLIVGDPLDNTGATWLRDALAERFPGQAVRYVLHTHHHFDRAEGAGVFGSGVVTVGHERFNEELARAQRSALYGLVRPVQHTVGEHDVITLGGRSVEVIYAGPGHARDMLVLYFPAERILFASEPPTPSGTPPSFGTFTIGEVLRWLDVVAGKPVDSLVTGDGRFLDAGSLLALRALITEVNTAVTRGVERGRSLSALRREALPASLAGNPHYAQREAFVDLSYRSLSVRELEVGGAFASASVFGANRDYCESFAECTPFGRRTTTGLGAVAWTRNRLGVAGEFAVDAQFVGRRSNPGYDDAVATRTSRMSGLLLFRTTSSRGVTLDLLAGPSVVVNDARGLDRVRNRVIPAGGRHDILSRETTVGFTMGTTFSLPLASRLTAHVPVRWTVFRWGDPEFRPGGNQLQVGAGLTLRLVRKVSPAGNRRAPAQTSPRMGGR